MVLYPILGGIMFFRFLIIVLALTLPAACTEIQGPAQISPNDLAREISASGENLVIVDVREPELYRAGHIPGAINLPYPDSKTIFPARLEPDQNIVFVCHSGPMGDEMAEILAKNGFPRIRNLKGGMKTWTGPLEGTP
jgi:rhodanese-related sulfurtransferase